MSSFTYTKIVKFAEEDPGGTLTKIAQAYAREKNVTFAEALRIVGNTEIGGKLHRDYVQLGRQP